MNVLKHNPVSLFESVFEFLISNDVLTLTQSNVKEIIKVSFEPHFLTNFFDFFDWISSWRQNEENGYIHLTLSSGILNNTNQDLVKGKVLVHRNELVSLREIKIDKLGHGCDHSVWSHGSDYAKLVEILLVQFSPIGRQFDRLRIELVKPVFEPCWEFLFDSFGQLFELFDFSQSSDVEPCLIRKPFFEMVFGVCLGNTV
jgi:hypothetical protein